MIKVIFLTLISWTSSGAQLDSIRLETINGKQFIIHQIVEKETLSSISRKYNVPITAILEVNPTADGGLATGQLLKVPYIFKGNKAQPQAGGERIHTVVTGETLYSVSRLYDVSVDDIKTWNNLNDNSLAAGQSLTIKKKSTTLSIVAIQPQEATKLSEAKSLKGVHTVVSKESMYSIARLYGISVGQLKEWNGMDEVELKIGQTLFIAQPKYNNAEGKPIQPQEAIKLSEAKSLTGVHTVVSKESMYSIARLYGITVGQLKEWNGMDEVELKIGQTLFIAQPMYDKAEVKTEQNSVTETKEPVELFKEVTPIQTQQETTITISEKVIGSDEVKQGGLAELIEGSEGNRKYLALHRSAKAGTILKVKNELNNREVFVRVAGPLPDTGVNTNVVIKISKSAYDRLGAIDQRFRVEVTYYK